MIRVLVTKNRVEIRGHALYDDYGKDIVCSAVSSIVITTVNGILSIDQDAISYKNSDNLMQIDILKNNEIIDKLINNMIDLLNSLSKDYPKNINVKESI